MEKALYVGIDFGNAFSQVSFYNFKENEPVSVDFSGLENRYQIPTVISKTLGREEWFIGDEAKNCAALGEAELVDDLIGKAINREPVIVDDISMMPMDLVRIFFDGLLHSVTLFSGIGTIGKICITLEEYRIGILNIISEALYGLGFSRDQFIFAGREESYIYYAMSQDKELWRGDVVLFDFDVKGLHYYRLYSVIERGTRIVMTHEENLEEEVPYVLLDGESAEGLLDERLTRCARALFENANVTTVYLTGKGFEGELHVPEFLRYICERRRVFAGQNLYTKGACYQAYESARENSAFKDMLLACPQRITTGVEVRIESQGRDKILRLVKPGVNWYGADVSVDFILDDIKELELFLSPLDTKEKQIAKISLEDFPDRPNKATRITLKMSFTSDSRCHVMILDRGFGDFFPSSARVINEELLL